MTMNRLHLPVIFTALVIACAGCAGRPAPLSFDLSPSGEQVAFTSAGEHLYLLDLKTSQVRQLTKPPGAQQTPSFSPEGKQIAYAAKGGGATSSFIYVRSLDGEQSRQLTNTDGISDAGPSFSPDGARIVFTRAHLHPPYSMGGWTWDHWDVYVVNADGSGLRRITQQNHYGASSPKFLRDGKTIVYSADTRRNPDDTTLAIFEVDAAGERPPKILTKDDRKTTNIGALGTDASVSPNGDTIAFVSDRIEPFHYDVFTMRRDGSNPRPLGVTSVTWHSSAPRFLPGGKGVIFLAENVGPGGSRIASLWQVDTDGTNLHELADDSLFTNPKGWKPRR